MEQEIDSSIKEILDDYYRKSPRTDYVELVQKILERKPDTSLVQIASVISSIVGKRNGLYSLPDFLVDVFLGITANFPAKTICDPWAGLGILINEIGKSTQADKLIAITNNQNEFNIGKMFATNAEWHNGLPIDIVDKLDYVFDIVASNLPFGGRYPKPIKVDTGHGKIIELNNDLGNLILVLTSLKLNSNGMGIFVVPNSFLFSTVSPRQHFNDLGLGIEAVMALPAGTFAPYTNVQTNIVIVRKKTFENIFVAQLTNDVKTNEEIISNYRSQKDTGNIGTGKYTVSKDFKDISSLRLADELVETYQIYGTPAVRLGDIAKATILGRFGKESLFTKDENSIYIPLLGNSDVVTSQDELTIKPQNYAQIIVDPSKSNALFVASFLNSELGKNIREKGKTGNIIPKFNLQSLKELLIFIPEIGMQNAILETEAKIAKEENYLSSLQNELSAFRNELWKNPKKVDVISNNVLGFSERFTWNLQQHTTEKLENWFETLPFPLASILRSWQAAQSEDYKTKYEHLLHFFEATSEFVSIILLSAFSKNNKIFDEHKEKLMQVLRGQNLSLQRSTFGTWKTVVEFLGKQTRQMLTGDDDSRALCADLFEDQNFALAKITASKDVAIILAETNKMRNDWSGHGGVVGQVEAKLRNEQLQNKLQKIRGFIGDAWANIDLIQCLHCKPRKGMFENEIAILTGSNSEFLKENRQMSAWLDVDQLYVMSKNSGRALQLLPLIQIGSSPISAKNACYFFNRLDKDGARFVSYHYVDEPELTGRFEETIKSIKFLME